MEVQTRPWESVFAGPAVVAVPSGAARFEEKAADISDQGRFED
ncbi:hypothetical protein YWIDRAFT_06509 [Streptomyces sp. SceaMP-e96]|nr:MULTISPECIES: hypothetical protein [unclassified Streptomyces]SCK36126.1 hypothetical protein YWIDRAFT_06509 [Streptomyces sp. SceaMP-e96]